MWLESKLIELGMVGDESKKYKISFVLDRGPMFSVYSMRHGKPFKHEVKVSKEYLCLGPTLEHSIN